MSTPDDAPLEEDDPFAVVRPTRWKTLEEQEIDEDANRMMASPRGLGPDTPSPAKLDDSDGDDVVQLAEGDASGEWADVPGADEEAFDDLMELAEDARRTVREKAASPARAEREAPTRASATSAAPMRASSARASSARVSATRVSATRVSASKPASKNACSTAPADAGALAEKKQWFADSNALRAKQRIAEAAISGVSSSSARPTIPAATSRPPSAAVPRELPDADLEAVARHGFAAAAADQSALRADLRSRLGRVRGGVARLASHVADLNAGGAYVDALGDLMHAAEKDIVALKEAQRAQYDRLVREEKDLARALDDFASRLDTWDRDKSDPVWIGAYDDPGKPGNARKPRKTYGGGDGGATAARDSDPWSRAPPRSVAARASRRDDDSESSSAEGSSPAPSPAKRSAKRPNTAGPGPWARAAGAGSSPAGGATRPRPRTAAAPGAVPPGGGGASEREPPPEAVAAHDRFLEDYGATGGWAEVDHARWRRCLARSNMNYGAATVLAAEELAAFGIERAEVVRHARWDAEREDLLAKKKAAVRAWRERRASAASAARSAADEKLAEEEEAKKRSAALRARANREREKAALEAWRAKKLEEEKRRREAEEAARRDDAENERERKREMRRERLERERRNAVRERARWEMQEASRAAAEAAAEALIPSAPPQTAREAKRERDRLAAKALDASRRRRDAGNAKALELEARKQRQLRAAERLRDKRRLQEGKSADVSDPTRLTRATTAHAMRVASEREKGPAFAAAPAVQYLQHRATPTWRAMR